MKYLNLLTKICAVIWYILIFILLIYFFTFCNILFTEELPNLPFLKIIVKDYDYSQLVSKLSFLSIILSHCLMILGFYYFRKMLISFKRLILFEDEVINNIKKSGSYIALSALSSYFFQLVFGIVGNFDYVNEVSQHLLKNSSLTQIKIFNTSLFFQFGIGLFFIVLSEVFSKAKQFKEENDLTV